MPVMNGVEATQILRSHGVLIPIIAVTGNALAEDVNAFIAAGCNHVLTKRRCTRAHHHDQRAVDGREWPLRCDAPRRAS